ncbi:hypothetical protein [Aeromonas rivipollensis]|uniref:hypothetical protein n=1 Tax=Aeromonas rivipollensis TaxID=948519 RepID=UPI0030CBE9CF
MDTLSRSTTFGYISSVGLSLILLMMLYASPMMVLLLVIVYVYVVRGKRLDNWFAFLSALFIATVASLVNPNGEVIGDVVRYYNRYDYNSDYYMSLLEMKAYQYALFNMMEYFGLPNRFYTFISIFLFTFNIISSILNIITGLNVEINGVKKNVLFIVLLFSFIPSSIYFSFEYLLALSFIVRGLSSILLKRYFPFLFWSLCGILIHNGIFYFIGIIILAHIIRKRNYTFALLLSSVMPLALFFLTSQAHVTGFDYLDLLFKKLYFYINGPWSRYETLADYDYFIYTFLRLLSFFLVLFIFIRYKVPHKGYTILILVISVSSLFFPPSRTLFFRYVYFGALFLIPAYVYIILKLKISQNVKYFFMLFILVSGFQYMNLSVYRLVSEHVEPLVLFGSIDKIASYKLNVPLDNLGSERE